MPCTRRAWLARCAGAGVATAGVTATAAAGHMGEQDPLTTLEYDEDTLLKYRPRLVTGHLDFRPNALYGWVARNPDFEHDVCVYWAAYDAQQDTGPWTWLIDTSHPGDHEPFYVAFDPDTGAVEEVVCSVYHWLAGRYDPAAITLDGRHPQFHVVKPWHQYRATTERGVFVELDSLVRVFESWLDNGMEEDLFPGAAVDPWLMLGASGRGHWWRSTSKALAISRLQSAMFLDVAGASESDPAGDVALF